MTITEIIQDVADEIVVQRSAIGRLREKHISLAGAFLVASTLFMVHLLLLSSALSYTAPLGIVALLAGFQWNMVYHEIGRMNRLLAQSIFYHDLVVEETYSGKEIGPDQTSGESFSAKAVEAVPPTFPASAY